MQSITAVFVASAFNVIANIVSPTLLLAGTSGLEQPIANPAYTEQEAELDPFLGKPVLEMQQIFRGERFPNVV